MLAMPPDLDPEAPGLDEETRIRRRALRKLVALSHEETFAFLVKIGIYTPDGQLAEIYRDDGESSPYRPND